MRTRWIVLIAAIAVAGWATWHWRARILLPWFEYRISREFQVDQLTADSLEAMLESGSDDILLLDTRSPGEFAVSRLEGAELVDWRQGSREFCRKFESRVRGRKVVLYCSIGYRSSVLLREVRDCLRRHGAGMSANLEGGIFNWYNQGRTVVAPDGAPTDSIHPFDSEWGHLVKQR